MLYLQYIYMTPYHFKYVTIRLNSYESLNIFRTLWLLRDRGSCENAEPAIRDPAAAALLLEAGACPGIATDVRNRFGGYDGLTAPGIAPTHALV